MNKRRVRIVLAPAMILLAAILALLGLAFGRTPPWYRPRELSEAETRRVRQAFDASFDHITRQLVAGLPFSVTLTEAEVNDLLAARAQIWPGAGRWLERAFAGPHVSIDDGAVRIGVARRVGCWCSVLSAELVPSVDHKVVSLTLGGLQAGGLRVPAAMVVRSLGLRPAGASTDATTGPAVVDELLGAGRRKQWRNCFFWPNGDIPFAVEAIVLKDDQLTLKLKPLM